MTNYEVFTQSNALPVKAWTKGVPFEDAARQQVMNVATLPFVHKWVAIMPDVHCGKGATIGSVIPTDKAIIPAAVGVDIGCGMMAAKTSLNANDLPDSLGHIRAAIEEAVPHGRSDNGGRNDRGKAHGQQVANRGDFPIEAISKRNSPRKSRGCSCHGVILIRGKP